MFRRSLSEALINALAEQPFWKNIVADRQLTPEIRDGHVTIYFRGGAMLKSLTHDGRSLVADVHPKYVPVQASRGSLRLTWTDAGFAFADDVKAMPFGAATAEVLHAYKEEMAKALVEHPEAAIVQKNIERVENTIVDQEITFQEPGESRDKIDLCHFDATLKKLVFVEVKRVEDSRLFKPAGRLTRPRYATSKTSPSESMVTLEKCSRYICGSKVWIGITVFAFTEVTNFTMSAM